MEHVETGFPDVKDDYLEPTEFLDFDRPVVRAFVDRAVDGAKTDIDKAIRLFYAVRDEIRYDPYRISDDPEVYRASNVIETKAAYCVPKAALLTAAARACGIPAAVGLSDVTNHMCSERMREAMSGKNLFMHHGYAVMHIDGKWVKAAAAFNIELCDKFDVTPTEFDGRSDALFQEFDKLGRKHMEYMKDHGMWSDLPLQRVVDDFTDFYGEALWQRCRDAVAQNEAKKAKNFEDEKPIS